jgi:hypothetical protein
MLALDLFALVMLEFDALLTAIEPRRSAIAATAAVTVATVTPVAVTVRVTVTAAAVNGVTA